MLPNGYSVPWLCFVLVWIVAAGNVKRAVKREPIRSMLVHRSLTALAFTLLVLPVRWGPLGTHLVPQTAAAGIAGLVLTSASLAFAIWTRLILGRNWSAAATIKEDHRLIRRGPYRLVRHPIYTGILLAVVGTAIGIGELRGFIAAPIALSAFWRKSRVEEQFMIAQFGEEYVEYRRETKALFPGLF